MFNMLDYQFLNNTILEYIISLSVFLISLLFLKIFKTVIIHKIKKVVEKNKTGKLIIERINNIGKFFYLFVSVYLAHFFIELPSFIEKGIYYLFLIIVTFYIVKLFQEFVEHVGKEIIKKREKETDDTTILRFLLRIIKGVIWGIALMLVLQNLGYDITTLIAGLGVGGIAIAFALQNILSDIFASFSIFFDKPFELGDFIIIDKDMGIVEKIGIKSTRIKTLHGEELVVSNRELTSTRIHNYKKMQKRRIVFGFGVTYGTATEKLKKVVEITKEIINKAENAELDRVHFKEFGDFSLNFEVVYYLISGNYGVYMDTQQEINFELKKRLEKEGVEMAYPTQTIFLKK